MKYLMIFLLLLFLLKSCEIWNNESGNECIEPVAYSEISFDCFEKLVTGVDSNVVVKSQEEYEQLINNLYYKRLEYYWEQNYQILLQKQKELYPGLTDEQYKILVEKAFYSLPFLQGIEDCTFPEINFSKSTLLGVTLTTLGCGPPNVEINVFDDKLNKSILFQIIINRNGDCEMAILIFRWILIPALPEFYQVDFDLNNE